jgi:hypothetical protein
MNSAPFVVIAPARHIHIRQPVGADTLKIIVRVRKPA